jgi:hypothetical protein
VIDLLSKDKEQHCEESPMPVGMALAQWRQHKRPEQPWRAG